MQSQCENHEGASVARLKSGADTLLFLATCSWTKTRGERMLLPLNGDIGRLTGCVSPCSHEICISRGLEI